MAKRKCKMKVWNVQAQVVTTEGRKFRGQISRGLPTVQVAACTEAAAKRAALREYKRRGEYKRLLARRGRVVHWAAGELGEHRGVNRYAADAPGPWW